MEDEGERGKWKEILEHRQKAGKGEKQQSNSETNYEK